MLVSITDNANLIAAYLQSNIVIILKYKLPFWEKT